MWWSDFLCTTPAMCGWNYFCCTPWPEQHPVQNKVVLDSLTLKMFLDSFVVFPTVLVPLWQLFKMAWKRGATPSLVKSSMAGKGKGFLPKYKKIKHISCSITRQKRWLIPITLMLFSSAFSANYETYNSLLNSPMEPNQPEIKS